MGYLAGWLVKYRHMHLTVLDKKWWAWNKLSKHTPSAALSSIQSKCAITYVLIPWSHHLLNSLSPSLIRFSEWLSLPPSPHPSKIITPPGTQSNLPGYLYLHPHSHLLKSHQLWKFHKVSHTPILLAFQLLRPDSRQAWTNSSLNDCRRLLKYLPTYVLLPSSLPFQSPLDSASRLILSSSHTLFKYYPWFKDHNERHEVQS